MVLTGLTRSSSCCDALVFVSGTVRVGVRDQLPVAGVDLILENYLAGVKVFPTTPEVTDEPAVDVCEMAIDSSPIFPAFVLTHATLAG